MSFPHQVLKHLIAIIKDSEFRKLRDSIVLKLLGSTQSEIRKVTALKCIKVLPKKRIVELLDAYLVSTEHRFYNVTHWLDMGVSLPRDRALRAAKNELLKLTDK